MAFPDAELDLQYGVELLVPQLRDANEFVRSMHSADRTIGISHGGWRLRIFTRETNPDGARKRALAALEYAANVHQQPHLMAEVEIGEATCRRPLPGSRRQVEVPVGHEHQEVSVDGRTIAAIRESHPLGEWVVWLLGQEPAWRGRSLGGLARELFQSPHGAPDPRVEEVVTRLVGQQTPEGTRFPCPCCEYLTLEEAAPGTFAVCPVCWWEDDGVQFVDPSYRGGANSPSLREARETFERIGVSEERLKAHARAPKPHEVPPR